MPLYQNILFQQQRFIAVWRNFTRPAKKTYNLLIKEEMRSDETDFVVNDK